MKEGDEKVAEDATGESESVVRYAKMGIGTGLKDQFEDSNYFECEECGYIIRVAGNATPTRCPLCHAEETFTFVCDEMDYRASGGILPKNKYAEPVLLLMIMEHPGLTAEELKAELENREKIREKLMEIDDEELYFDMLKNEVRYFLWPSEKLQRALDHLLLDQIIISEVGADQKTRYYLHYPKVNE